MRAWTFSHASLYRSPAKHEKNISSQFQNSELFHARRINVAQSGDQGGEVTPKTWGNEVKPRERYKVSSSPVCQSHPPQNTVHWEMILMKCPSSHDLVVYQDIRVVFSFEHRPGWHCTCSHRIPLSHYPFGRGRFYGRPHMFLEHMDSVGHTNVCMKIWQAFLGNISLIDASISNTFLFKSSVWQAVCRSHGCMWNILLSLFLSANVKNMIVCIYQDYKYTVLIRHHLSQSHVCSFISETAKQYLPFRCLRKAAVLTSKGEKGIVRRCMSRISHKEFNVPIQLRKASAILHGNPILTLTHQRVVCDVWPRERIASISECLSSCHETWFTHEITANSPSTTHGKQRSIWKTPLHSYTSQSFCSITCSFVLYINPKEILMGMRIETVWRE